MPGGLTLLAGADADIPTPVSGKVTIFFSTDLGGPAYKNDSGTVLPLGTTGTTGAQGPIGPAIPLLLEALDGEDGIPIPGIPGPIGPAGNDTTIVIAISDESLANNTLQDDDELLFAVEANSVYYFELIAWFTSGTSSDVDVQHAFTFPVSAIITYNAFGYSLTATSLNAFVSNSDYQDSSPSTTRLNGVLSTATAPASAIRIVGILTVGANAGTLQFQWAQNTNTPGTPLVRKADSQIKIQKIS